MSRADVDGKQLRSLVAIELTGAGMAEAAIELRSRWADCPLSGDHFHRTCVALVHRRLPTGKSAPDKSDQREKPVDQFFVDPMFECVPRTSPMWVAVADELQCLANKTFHSSSSTSAPASVSITSNPVGAGSVFRSVEPLLVVTGMHLSLSANSGHITDALLIDATKNVRKVIADLINVARNLHSDRARDMVSSRWHMDGRWVHQILCSHQLLKPSSSSSASSSASPPSLPAPSTSPSSLSLPSLRALGVWVGALRDTLDLALHCHFGVAQLRFLNQHFLSAETAPAPTPSNATVIVSLTLKRLAAVLKGAVPTNTKVPTGVAKELWEQLRRCAIDFYRSLTPTELFASQLVQRLANVNDHLVQQSTDKEEAVVAAQSLHEFLAAGAQAFADDPAVRAIQAHPAIEMPDHIVPSSASSTGFCTVGFFADMVHRRARPASAQDYEQYLAREHELAKWTKLIQKTAAELGPPLTVRAITAPPKTSQMATVAKTTTALERKVRSKAGKKSKRPSSVFADLLKEVAGISDQPGRPSDAHADARDVEAKIQQLQASNEPGKTGKSEAERKGPSKKRKKSPDDKADKDKVSKKPRATSHAQSALVSCTQHWASQEACSSFAVSDGQVDELGRCFVATPLSMSLLLERQKRDVDDPFMWWMWNKRSHILRDMALETQWRNVQPLPKAGGLDLVECMRDHLGIRSHPSKSQAETDAAIYGGPDGHIQPELLRRLDLAYVAMVGTGEITTHRDILFSPGLRGFFIDAWRTLVLTGSKAITPQSLAFVCSVAVYCMDSSDPADQADYRSLTQILLCFTERAPSPADFLGCACAHKGTPLSRVHPLSGSKSGLRVDELGFGPRLLLWLVQSQRLPAAQPLLGVPQRPTTLSGVDQYPVGRLCAAQGRPRWVESVAMMITIASVYFHPIVASQTIKNKTLTLTDVLRISLRASVHNETVKDLTDSWSQYGVAVTSDSDLDYLHEPKLHPDGKKPHELWRLSRSDLKELVPQIHQSLARLVGCDANRTALVTWLQQAQHMICASSKIKTADKIALSQFATFFIAAVDSTTGAKLSKYAASIVADVLQTDKATTYKLLYVPRTNVHSFHTEKVEDDHDAEKRRQIVARLVETHKWRFKLRAIERAADENGLLPPDTNLSSIEHKFNALRLQQQSKPIPTVPIGTTLPSGTNATANWSTPPNPPPPSAMEAYLNEPILHYLPSSQPQRPNDPNDIESVATVDVSLLVHGSVETAPPPPPPLPQAVDPHNPQSQAIVAISTNPNASLRIPSPTSFLE